MVSQDFLLATSGEDFKILIWDLHSYYAKQSITLPNVSSIACMSNIDIEMDERFKHDYIVKMQFLRNTPNILMCMNENGDVHELNTYSGEISANTINIGLNTGFVLND